MDRRFYDLRDGQISALHFNADKGPVELVFAHANGFNAMSYRQVLEPLGVHTIALDMRGHGFSELPYDPPRLKSWNLFANDIVDFFNRYIETPVCLGAHSFGGGSSILAMSRIKYKVKGAAIFDPPTMPLTVGGMMHIGSFRRVMIRSTPVMANAGKRRDVFPDMEFARDYYKNRGIFKFMPETIMHDYLKGGLKPHGESLKLCCDPLWEQAIYAAQGHNIFKAARHMPKNSVIAYAGVGSPTTHLSRLRVKRLSKGRVDHLPKAHHMFPLNQPDIAINYLKSVMG